jgi:hypothetical protein
MVPMSLKQGLNPAVSDQWYPLGVSSIFDKNWIGVLCASLLPEQVGVLVTILWIN